MATFLCLKSIESPLHKKETYFLYSLPQSCRLKYRVLNKWTLYSCQLKRRLESLFLAVVMLAAERQPHHDCGGWAESAPMAMFCEVMVWGCALCKCMGSWLMGCMGPITYQIGAIPLASTLMHMWQCAPWEHFLMFCQCKAWYIACRENRFGKNSQPM